MLRDFFLSRQFESSPWWNGKMTLFLILEAIAILIMVYPAVSTAAVHTAQDPFIID